MAENATGAVATETATKVDTTAEAGKEQTNQQEQQTNLTAEDIRKLIQAESDKKTAEIGKQNAALKKEIEQMKKEKMSQEELKKFEDDQRAKEMADKEKVLTERENRLTAIDELTKVELFDSSEATNAFLDLVIKGADETEIRNNVKAIKAFIDKKIALGVDATFKANGRTPNGGDKGATKSSEISIAEKLGKQTAERAKNSNEILDYYYGGKK